MREKVARHTLLSPIPPERMGFSVLDPSLAASQNLEGELPWKIKNIVFGFACGVILRLLLYCLGIW